jgi:hypothetical protein
MVEVSHTGGVRWCMARERELRLPRCSARSCQFCVQEQAGSLCGSARKAGYVVVRVLGTEGNEADPCAVLMGSTREDTLEKLVDVVLPQACVMRREVRGPLGGGSRRLQRRVLEGWVKGGTHSSDAGPMCVRRWCGSNDRGFCVVTAHSTAGNEPRVDAQMMVAESDMLCFSWWTPRKRCR